MWNIFARVNSPNLQRNLIAAVEPIDSTVKPKQGLLVQLFGQHYIILSR